MVRMCVHQLGMHRVSKYVLCCSESITGDVYLLQTDICSDKTNQQYRLYSQNFFGWRS